MEEARASRHVFPGSNTPLGFYSYYHHILPHEQARKRFVIKGGPGAGKSSFMRRIAEACEKEGVQVEFHHCAADDDSLDAVVLPRAGVALVDGTAPHTVDPEFPGAIDQLLNFGEFWDEAKIRAERDAIVAASLEIGEAYRRGYRYLAAARSVYDDIEAINRRLVDFGALNQMTDSLIDELIGGRTAAARPGSVRKLFGSAITPGGVRHHLESIIGPMAYKVAVRGQPGTGKSTLIGELARQAARRGIDVEVFCCPFDPEKPEHLVIPSLDLAVTASVRPHLWTGSVDLEVNTDQALDEARQSRYAANIAQDQETYRNLMEDAVAALADAKRIHDEIESYYVPAMDFARIDELFAEVLSGIRLEIGAAAQPA